MIEQIQGFRLSPQQSRLWSGAMGHQMRGIYSLIRIEGQLHSLRLQRAIQVVVQRHEILRTTYQHIPGMQIPVQCIADTATYAWQCIDLREFSLQGQSEEVERLLQQEMCSLPANVQTIPLRLKLLFLSASTHLLLVSLPALSADSRTFNNLVQEIAYAYGDDAQAEDDDTRDIIQYIQFSEWQHEILENEEEAQQGKAYWQKQNGMQPVTLPTEKRSPERTTPAIGTFTSILSADVLDGIEHMLQDVPASTFFLACWQILLWRLTGENDIAVHFLQSRRTYAELSAMLGLYAQPLPISSHFVVNASFRTILEQLHQTVEDAEAWQEYFVEEQRHDASIGFLWEEGPEPCTVEDITFCVQQQQSYIEPFKLQLACTLQEHRPQLRFSYDTARFASDTIERLAGQMLVLVQCAAAYPERAINTLDILSSQERQQLLIDLNQTHQVYPGKPCFQSLFEEQVARTPNNVAIVYADLQLTYAELNARANQLAHYLRRLGVGPEVRVAICLERSVAMVVGILAILKAGGAYVPLDATYPAARLTFLLQDIQAPVLVTNTQLAAAIPPHTARQVCLDTDWASIGSESTTNPVCTVLPEHLAYVLYTSGSTGRPRGIMVAHQSLSNYLNWCTGAYHAAEGQGTLVHSSLAFDLTITSLFSPLLVGQRALLLPESRGIESLANALRAENDFSLVKITPSHLEALNQWLPLQELAGRCKALVIGGEALLAEKLSAWREQTSTRLINEYGPTETVVGCSVYQVTAEDEQAGAVSIGKPISNMQIYILDQHQQPVPVGVSGELCISGAGLARGYLNRPDQTAERFIPHPFSSEPGSRLYRSGDLARYRSDGNIEYLGRLDTQVKVRGYRIEPGEIESVLRQHPAVEEAVVLAREERETGDRCLAAYVVPQKRHASTVQRLLRFEREGLLNGRTLYELPNGMVVIQHARSETQLIYREIFEESVYMGPGISLPDNACVFDVGANIGLFSIFIGERCRNARIYAFEPAPPVFEIMRLNTELYGLNVVPFACGISNQARDALFTYYPHSSVISGLFANAAEERKLVKTYLHQQQQHDPDLAGVSDETLDELLEERLATQQFTCQLKTISDVLNEQGLEHIDLLKIDVEKSELDVLAGIQEHDWSKIRQIVVEVHDIDGHLAIIEQLLRRHHYTVTIVKDDLFKDSELYNVYAVRPVLDSQSGARNSAAPDRVWYTPQQLVKDLLSCSKDYLPDYMVPSAFVLLEALPLTTNGKIDRKALPDPGSSEPGDKQTYVAPRTYVEQALADIWARVLGVKRVGIEDNFFEAGGHSMLATQLISRLRLNLQVEIPLGVFFEAPTIVELARQVEGALNSQEREALPPIVPTPRTDALPLSFAQQRLWFLDQLEPGDTAYIIPGALHLCGPLERVALARAYYEVQQRHEALRTSFPAHDGRPVQHIAAAPASLLIHLDLSSLPVETGQQEARRLAQQEAQQPFDLAHGPLLRSWLIQIREHDHVYLLSLHHIISDGWSNTILLRELRQFYRAFVSGQSSPLAPLPIQYADYALWQHNWLRGEVLQRQIDYWKGQLAGLMPLELPTRPRPLIQSHRGASQELHLQGQLLQDLLALSHREGVTLFMTLLAAFQVLLSRYCGQQDIAVGIPIANRRHTEVEGLIGFFVNTLVMRSDLSGQPGFVDLLQRVRRVTLDAYAHQDVPFEMLVEQLEPQRDLSRSPLFQVAFSLQEALETSESMQGVALESMEIASTVAKFDLTLVMTSRDQELFCHVNYNTDLFDAGMMRQLLEHWQVLLHGIVAAPQQAISTLPLLSPAERHRQLFHWNTTTTEEGTGAIYNPASLQGTGTLDQPASFEERAEMRLHQRIEACVEATPDSVAVLSGEMQLTYQALNSRANQLARYLHGIGIEPGMTIGVCLERSLDLVVGLLALLKLGCVYLPLDPLAPQERLALLMKHAAVSALLTTRQLQTIPVDVRTICLDQDWGTIAQQRADNPNRNVCLEDAAYVIYTSGSTGEPKGVVVTGRSLLKLCLWYISYSCITEESVLLLAITSTFDASIKNILTPLLCGGQLVLAPAGYYDAKNIANVIQHNGVSILNSTPSMFYALLEEAAAHQFASLAALAYVHLGGEALTRSRLMSWLNSPSCHATVTNIYGPTECTDIATCHTLNTAQSGEAVPIGHPIDNAHIYILSEQLQLLPAGVPGEIYIGGCGIARGYLNQSDLTAERFLPDPFSTVPGARIYRSGDLARYLSDGTIEYLGRMDNQVKLRGYRIEPGEIEVALQEHPGVRQCVVALQEMQLVAYVVPSSPSDTPGIDSTALRRFLKTRLPAYMLPAHFTFMDMLPLTSAGKIDRQHLPVPQWDKERRSDQKRMLLSPMEELVLQCWQEVLQREQIGVQEHFFEIGGHSLLATRVIARLRRLLGADVPLRVLFEAPTVQDLAARLQQEISQGWEIPAIVPAAQSENLPLSYEQQRLWFLYQLAPGSTAYNVPGAVRVRGNLEVAALQRSFFALVQRHDSLRARFAAISGQVLQHIAPLGELAFSVLDLSACEAPWREAVLQRLLQEEASQPFDLSRGPLFRVALLKLEVQDYILLLSLHHIIADGWSMNVLVRELTALYRAFVAGEPSPLPPLPISYTDYALWQRNWLQGEVLEEQIRYWTRQLHGAKALELPGDYPRPQVFSQHGASYDFTLNSELVQGLVHLSRQEGVTLFMTLLAAFQVLLYRITGELDIVVGTDSANRTQLETEGLIGFFVNLLALRTTLGGNPTFRQVLRAVRETVLEAHMHQHLPFEMLIEHLRLAQRGNGTPLVNVLFVVQNANKVEAKLPGLLIQPVKRENTSAKFDLALFLSEEAQHWHGAVNYSSDLFKEATIANIMNSYHIVLRDIVAHPEFPIDDLETQIEGERQLRSVQKQKRLGHYLSKIRDTKGDVIDLS